MNLTPLGCLSAIQTEYHFSLKAFFVELPGPGWTLKIFLVSKMLLNSSTEDEDSKIIPSNAAGREEAFSLDYMLDVTLLLLLLLFD